MVVTHYGNQQYYGLSTDTKPVPADTAIGATFEETDTGKKFYNSGTAWLPVLIRGAYNQIVFKEGSTYYATDSNGDILNSSTSNPGAVIQTCLDLAGTTYVSAGDYTMGASFAGVNVGIDGTHLMMDSGCILTVPAGYTGYVIKVKRALSTGPNLHHAKVSGGKLYEATGVSGSHLWTGILMQGGPLTNQGVGFSTVENVFIEYAGTGVNLDCTLGWVNGCLLQNVTCSGCPVGFDFTQPDPFTTAQNAIARDTFINCVVQNYASVPTLYGFKNIRWKDHVFIHCKVWDQTDTATQKASTIHRDAKNISIMGGIMSRGSSAGSYFVDNSKSTLIMQDEWNGPKYGGLSMVGHLFGIIGRKIGRHDSSSANTGTGILGTSTSYASEGSNAEVLTFADGTGGRLRTTAGTSGSGCGSRYTVNITCRGFNPIYKIMFKLTQTSNTRPYFGWTSSGSVDLAGDDPLNAVHGVILTARAADTNFQIGHNNGSGVTVFTDTGIPLNTSLNVFDLVADDAATNKWKWALYTVSSLRSISQSMVDYTELTSLEIPSQSQGLKPYWQMTTSENLAKSFTHYQVYVETD